MSSLASEHVLPRLRFGVVMTLVCGLVYPLVTTAAGRALFPELAAGSVIEVDGRKVGSRLVAQPFVSDIYLHGRPSACRHDPRRLAGSNLAPSNVDLRRRVGEDVAAIVAREGVSAAVVPPDLVAASGSCIDPDITPAAARLQVPRIARARGVAPERIEAALEAARSDRGTLDLGPPRVNVLEANLALDRSSPRDAR